MSTQKPRNAYSRIRVGLDTGSDSRVDQSQREFTDINKIVARAHRTGQWPPRHPHGRVPFYADATKVGSLQEAYELAERASNAFMELPAQVRRSMDNDPRNLERWLADPKNWPVAAEAGLITLPEAPQEPASAPQPKARTASPAAPKTSSKAKPEAPAGDEE